MAEQNGVPLKMDNLCLRPFNLQSSIDYARQNFFEIPTQRFFWHMMKGAITATKSQVMASRLFWFMGFQAGG